MPVKLSKADQLAPYRMNEMLIRETAARIINDFQLFGFEITFSGNTDNAYNELSAQLLPVFEKLFQTNRQKLMRILYIIDIAENSISATEKKFPKATVAEIITHLVIERELQKVVTRRYFAPPKSSPNGEDNYPT